MEIKKLSLKKVIRKFIKENVAEQSNSFDFNSKNIGDIISLKFRDVDLVIKKIGNNLFEVINNGKSIKLKEGDILSIQDSQQVNVGDSMEFEIFRKTNFEYKSDPVKMIG